jgi:hypothetical protein
MPWDTIPEEAPREVPWIHTVMPASGWGAVFVNLDGTTRWEPLVGWALVEDEGIEENDGSVGRLTEVRGVVVDDSTFTKVIAPSDDNFAGYDTESGYDRDPEKWAAAARSRAERLQRQAASVRRRLE